MIDFLKDLLLVTPQSEDRLLRITIKIVFNILCIVQTYWIAEQLGYPIPVNLFDQIVINKMFAQYYILVPIMIFFTYLVFLELFSNIVPSILMWSLVVWIHYHARYTLINFWTKRKITDLQNFLVERNNSLINDLRNSEYISAPLKDDQLLADHIFKFSTALVSSPKVRPFES